MQSGYRKSLMVLMLMLLGCSPQVDSEAPEAPPAQAATPPKPGKDLITFTLPEDVKAAAPKMQDHLFRVLPYNTIRWQVKPQFVFLDEDVETRGQLTNQIARLNLLHMAYYQADQLVWSGSLMHGRAQGRTVNAAAGYEISLTSTVDTLTLSFKDGEETLTSSFPVDQDAERTVSSDSARLYLNHYIFPAELVRGKKTPQQAPEGGR